MARQRRYSDDDRANALAALAANGGSVPITAARLGIPYRTLKQWADGHRHPESAQLSNEKKGALADALRGIAWLALDLLPDKLTKATAKDTATTLGIALDKAQLLDGDPTSIVRNEELSDDQRRARVAAYLERLRADGPGNGTGDRQPA
jgi:transposase-like protein